MSKRGWQDLEKNWQDTAFPSTKDRIRKLCRYADIMRQDSPQKASYLAAKLWKEEHNKK